MISRAVVPGLILADLGPTGPMLVFVEVVASDGPANEARQDAFYKLTDAAGFDRKPAAFVTVYLDRQFPSFKRTIPHIA